MPGKNGNKQKAIWMVIFQYWIPPLITAVLGFAVGLYMSRMGDISAERRLYLTSRVNQAEVVATSFDQYIENWRRLIQIATYEKQKGRLDEDETKRKNGYVTARDVSRDKLFGGLGALELYFGPKVLQKAAEFRSWDDAQTVKPLEQLPPLTEWRKHKAAVISVIRNEMEGRP